MLLNQLSQNLKHRVKAHESFFFFLSAKIIFYILNGVPEVLIIQKEAILMVPQSDIHILRGNQAMDTICI